MSATRTGPHSARPGYSRCPGFGRKKVTVSRAFTATPRTCPLFPSSPDGTSTATTGAPDALTRSTAARAPLEIPRQPGPEQRIDDDIRLGRIGLSQRRCVSLPERGGRGRVALQRVPRAKQRKAHPVAALLQNPRGDEAVPAIVAGSAQHQHACAGAVRPGDGVSDGPPCSVHQRTPGVPPAMARASARPISAVSRSSIIGRRRLSCSCPAIRR